ncbi:MAG TPA: succinate dehydrogenase, partial [Candidatus Eisenbacteria bacterium]|nr:succinate dehydrogenase [Candidatus Eisenbacteria bacterium]
MARVAEAVASTESRSTDRRDAWWLPPVSVAVGLGVLGLYLTWAAFQNANFRFHNYLSPVYSPEVHPSWWPLSPAFLILIPPAFFRTTCYYYRKAYYRAFFWDPPACAVGEPHRNYTGEQKFPFILQNLHRYAFYLAAFWLI